MEVTAEALAVLLFLLPGFLTSRIVGTIVVRRSTDHVREAIEALIYSFLIYAALDLVGWGVVVYDPAGGSAPKVDPGRPWHALVAAVLFAIVCGAFINHDLHMRFLRLAGLTNKTARANTWSDVFAERHDGVMVNYADGRRLTGWPALVSDDREEGLVYLCAPAWVDSDGNTHSVEGDGILIDVKNGIDSIEFLKGETGNA